MMDSGSAPKAVKATCRACGAVLDIRGLSPEESARKMAEHGATHGFSASSGSFPGVPAPPRIPNASPPPFAGPSGPAVADADEIYEQPGVGSLFGEFSEAEVVDSSPANIDSSHGAANDPLGKLFSTPVGADSAGGGASTVGDVAEGAVKKYIQSKTGNSATGGAEKNVIKAATDVASVAADKDMTAEEKFDEASYIVGKEGAKGAAKAGLAYMGAGAAADPLVENPLGNAVADAAGRGFQQQAQTTRKAASTIPGVKATAKAGRKIKDSKAVTKAKDSAKSSAGKLHLGKGSRPRRALSKAARPVKFLVGLPKKAKSLMAIMVVVALVVGAGFIGGAVMTAATSVGDVDNGYLWGVEPNLETIDIPEPYLEAYLNAGMSANVPWTLLAAVGARASAHGRVNPYEQDVPQPTVGSATTPTIPVSSGASAGPDDPASPASIPAESNSVLVLASSDTGDTESSRAAIAAAFEGSGLAVDIVLANPEIATADWAIEQVKGTDLPPGSRVVVAVGEGDLANPKFRDSAARLLQSLSGNKVVWLTLAGGEEVSRVNRTLFDLQARYRHLRVADWKSAAEGNGVVAAPDGRLSEESMRAKADFMKGHATGDAGSTVLGQDAGGGLSGPGVLPEPSGSCPDLEKPIVGPNPERGFGPLMLSPGALGKTSEEDIADLQNICRSANILAAAMSAEASEVARSMGLSYPTSFRELIPKAQKGDMQAAETIQAFWVKVMGGVDILGTTDKRECIADPRPEDVEFPDYVVGTIRTVWGCTLAGSRLESVATARLVDGTVSFTTLSPAEARRRAVSEAIEVAWVFSRWGEELEPSSDGSPDSGSQCNPGAPLAGVFPLAESTFKQYLPERLEGATRCDVEANVVAAARAYAAGESSKLETRRGGATGYLAAYGGWGNFGSSVVGPSGVQQEFGSSGPYRRFVVPEVCADAARPVVASWAFDTGNPLTEVSPGVLLAYANRGSALPDDVLRELDAYLVERVPDVFAVEQCAELPRDRWASVVVAGSSVSDGSLPLPPPDTAAEGSVSQQSAEAASRAIAAYATSKVSPDTAVDPRLGSTAILQRLSPSLLGSSESPPVPQWAPLTDRGLDLVQVAMTVYGGLYPFGPMVGGGLFSGANCPPEAPPNTLRDGAEAIGAAELCSQAVSQAATPQAALAIVWAFQNLGKEYAWPVGVPRDGPDMYDCSSYVSHAYFDTTGIPIAGENWSYSTRNMMPWDGVKLDPHFEVLADGAERPGDLVMETTPSPDSEHVLMYLGEVNGVRWVAHTNMPGDVSKVEMMPSSGIVGYRRVNAITEEEKAKVAEAAAALSAPAMSLTPGGPVPPGDGPVWLAKFLYSQGLRGQPLRVMWSIAMRESGGQRGTVSSMDGNGYGLFQIQYGVGHDTWIEEKFGWDMSTRESFARNMVDPVKNFQVAMELTDNFTDLSDWGHNSANDPSLNTSKYQSWNSRYTDDGRTWAQAYIIDNFQQYYVQFPQVAREAGIPGV